MKAIKFKIYLMLIAWWLLFSSSCTKSTTDPPPPSGPDTTSHNFTWQIDTIGTNSSYLQDVAIIDENDIWAVGEIHTPETDRFDSLGNWIPPFNAVHWNGQEWDLKRILYENGWWSIGTIFAFDSNDIWFDPWMHWDGIRFEGKPIPNILVGHSINKMWGTSSSDLYVGGSNGLLAHYNGSSWQKLVSGTDTDIQDIWGAQNPVNGEYEILAAASLQNRGRELDLLCINDNRVTQMDTTGLHVNQSSLWFIPEKAYYVTGNGVFTKNRLGDPSWQSETGHPLLYKDAVRGNDWNDVFIVGAFGLVSHFNGSTWRHYTGNELPSLSGLWNAVAIKQDFVVAAGELASNQGIVLKGIR